MINLAKSKKNNDVFFNFVADLLGSRGYKISDNVFLSLNFSELAHVTSLLIAATPPLKLRDGGDSNDPNLKGLL